MLGDQDVAPWTKAWLSASARVHGIAKGLANGADVRHQAIGTDQQGATCRTAPHPLDQPPDQGHITLLADRTAQPQARRDHHSQRHPHDAALFLDTEFIGLHLSQVPWLFDQVLVHGLSCRPERAHQSAMVRSSNPKAATIACTGQPWASKVTTITTVSAEVRSR